LGFQRVGTEFAIENKVSEFLKMFGSKFCKKENGYENKSSVYPRAKQDEQEPLL